MPSLTIVGSLFALVLSSDHQNEATSLLQRSQKLEIHHNVDLAATQGSRSINAGDACPACPAGISPLDLWGIHDLLMIGHKGPLLENGNVVPKPAAKLLVETAAESLAGMLHKIHPVASCRQAIALADSLQSKAEASWTCLGLNAQNFSGPFRSEQDHFANVANTQPLFEAQLGACKGSQWPRACSYWTSMHAMGVRADMEGAQKAKDYFRDLSHIIAGGALYCFGCTSHFRFLNHHMLPTELQKETNLLFY